MTDEDDAVVIVDDPKEGARPRGPRGGSHWKHEHYVTLCISMYSDDREAALAKVAALKARGFTQMSLSRLIRIAVDRLDLDDLDRELRSSGVKR